MKILITGGSAGLGAAMVKKLAAQNSHQIYFTYASSKAAAMELENSFQQVHSRHCDFSDPLSVERLLNEIPDWDLDVLINNAAGPIEKTHFHKTDPNAFLHAFRRDILPVLQITQSVIPGFRKKKFGKIINILSSVVVNHPPIGWSGYAAGKNYLLSMSKSWVSENARFNITVNNISPAFMQTGLTADTDERILEQMRDAHPLKKLLTTDEVADAALFLVSCSQQINGTNLIINAGTDLV